MCKRFICHCIKTTPTSTCNTEDLLATTSSYHDDNDNDETPSFQHHTEEEEEDTVVVPPVGVNVPMVEVNQAGHVVGNLNGNVSGLT
eukprot:3455364-Ditylum_brightwellii.AAC.1